MGTSMLVAEEDVEPSEEEPLEESSPGEQARNEIVTKPRIGKRRKWRKVMLYLVYLKIGGFVRQEPPHQSHCQY